MTLNGETLYHLKAQDLKRAAAAMVDAFARDPVWNAMFQDEPASEKRRLLFFETPIRYCLAHGEVSATSSAIEGLCASLPGHRADMTLWRLIQSGALFPALRLGMRFAMKMKRVFDPIQAHRRATMKDRDYIYIQMIGVA